MYRQRKRLTEKQMFEVCLGATLTQNTSWGNVERALANIKAAKALSPKAIARMPTRKLAKLIQPARYMNQKSKYLKNFCKFLLKNYKGSMHKLARKSARELRAELLALKGIGNETADSIVLYACNKPSFVVDAYTHRILERVYGKPKQGYVETQAEFERSLPRSARLYNEFHALLVALGKEFCSPKPRCSGCPVGGACFHAKSHAKSISQ